MSVNVTDKLESGIVPLKILVVDDDLLNQRMMRLILSREGYEIFIASNGVEAVEMAKASDFDVILMDLQMPILDGVGASRRIREFETEGRHVFIVALTASFLPEKGQELFEAGIDNYISKPFDLDHLRQILRYSHNSGIPNESPEGKDAGTASISFAAGLHKVGGSEEIYRELLGDFIQELPGKLETLRTCHSENNLEMLSRAAHNLKGVSANLGAMRLSEEAGKLEREVDAGSGEIKHIIAMVRVAADEFQKSASKYLFK